MRERGERERETLVMTDGASTVLWVLASRAVASVSSESFKVVVTEDIVTVTVGLSFLA